MRTFFILAAAVAAGTLAQPKQAGAVRSATALPNIVFVLADDLGYGDLGSYGQSRPHRTPRAAYAAMVTCLDIGSSPPDRRA